MISHQIAKGITGMHQQSHFPSTIPHVGSVCLVSSSPDRTNAVSQALQLILMQWRLHDTYHPTSSKRKWVPYASQPEYQEMIQLLYFFTAEFVSLARWNPIYPKVCVATEEKYELVDLKFFGTGLAGQPGLCKIAQVRWAQKSKPSFLSAISWFFDLCYHHRPLSSQLRHFPP